MDIIEHRILSLLRDKEEDITINDIAKAVKMDRHTAAKRLEVLRSKGLIEYRIVGKSKMWKISQSPFLSALKNNDDISNNIKNILQHVDGEVNIQDQKNIIWSKNREEPCCAKRNRCKDCSVEKTFKTGNPESSVKAWSKKKVKITTQPIKDSHNRTIAVIEVIKDAKNIKVKK